MRKKALLVGARSNFEGPWVFVEAGEWLVEPILHVGIVCENEMIVRKEPTVSVIGPTRVRAIVFPEYDNPEDVYLSIIQVR